MSKEEDQPIEHYLNKKLKYEIDFSWKNPSPAQVAALKIATKRKTSQLTEFQAAEFIMLAPESLWAHQANEWTTNPPAFIDENLDRYFKTLARVLLDIVNIGYDEKTDTWWDITKVYGKDKNIRAALILQLMDLGLMIEQARGRTQYIISTGFNFFLEIVIGKDWQKKAKKVLPQFTDRVLKAIQTVNE